MTDKQDMSKKSLLYRICFDPKYTNIGCWTILSLFILAITLSGPVLPIVGDEEYFISDGLVHCKAHGEHSAWFKFKRQRYNLILKADEEICPVCWYEDEIDKVKFISTFNYIRAREYAKRYKSKDEYQNFLQKYQKKKLDY